MSDLAGCCEYLTSEKLCSAVSDNEKAKAARQVRCKNDEKMTCCYICLFRRKCAINCRFLGNIENESQQIGTEKTEVDNTKNAPVTCCSLCNVKMSQTKTKFRITGWEGSDQKLADDDSGKLGDELLPAIIYLCPKCGRIEFSAR